MRSIIPAIFPILGAAVLHAVEPPAEPMSIWMDTPAKSFHQSVVVGNGRLGAMDFGGVVKDRIVLNESSMWSGGPYDANNHEAAKCLPEVRALLFAGDTGAADKLLRKSFSYPAGVRGWWDENQFGCYQILADLLLDFGAAAAPAFRITSPTGHQDGDGKGIDGCTDANPQTKWCVQNAGPRVQWQLELPAAQEVKSYTLTSADDVPTRDPQDWTLEGSADGTTWAELDQQVRPGPFEKRFEAKSFTIAKPGAYRFYRFTFRPRDPYFQVAEIALAGVQSEEKPAATHTSYTGIGPAGAAGDYVPPTKVEGGATDYRRDLNLMTGFATTRYTLDGVTFTRELVASKPDEVIAFRMRASKPGALNFRAKLARKVNAATRAGDQVFVLEGQLPFNSPTGAAQGVKYQALLGVTAKGGTAEVTADGWTVTGADEATLIVSAGTDLYDREHMVTVARRLAAAQQRGFDAIAKAATADHASLMNRCRLKLPAGPNAALPTPERVKRNEANPDPALAALYFQFGRHLTVAGSRPDSQLPSNLQGIWAEEYSTPWRGDFHSNINLQMNYWPALVGNLADCHLPLIRFIEGTAKEGAKTAQHYFGAPGWTAYHTQNPWFETAPSHLPATAGPTCGAWLAFHIWEHYRFTQDRDFLKQYYPLLRGAAEFCAAVLVEDPKTKRLVTVPSSSPENSYAFTDPSGKRQTTWLCIGSTYDMQIMRGVLEGTAAAARLLGVDAEFAAKLDATRARLTPTKVNAEGRIMEWQEDFEEVEVHHRHSSHLWGLYPGTEISPATPELFEGARKSLDRRGDASTGWSMAWKANFWARLHDGDRAAKLLSMLIGRGGGNLMCLHPPFQIDGNFGGCAAVGEMLVQSHEEGSGFRVQRSGGSEPRTLNSEHIVHLLPALPAAWSEGSATGLRARGNLTVDIAWKDGRVTGYLITSPTLREVKVRVNGEVKTVRAGPAS
jgi:alpha-L-fucosidase 2